MTINSLLVLIYNLPNHIYYIYKYFVISYLTTSEYFYIYLQIFINK